MSLKLKKYFLFHFFLGVVLLLSIWFWSRAGDLNSQLLLGVWLTVGVGALFVKRWEKKDFLIWLGFVFFIIVNLIGTAIDKWTTLKWGLVYSLILLFFLEIKEISKKWKKKDLFSFATVLMLIYLLIFSLISWFNLQAYGLGRVPKISGPFYWHNQMGGWLLMVSPSLLWLAYKKKEEAARLVYILVYATSLALLSMTLSRGSWLAWLVSLFFLLFWLGIKKKIKGYFFFSWKEVGLVLILAFSFMLIFNRHIVKTVTGHTEVLIEESKGQNQSQGPASISWEYRLIAFSDTLKVIRRRPLLGVGLGDFRYYYRLIQNHPWIMVNFVHSQPLQLAAEGGVIAGLLWLVWVGWVIWSGLSFVVSERGSKDRRMLILLLTWGFLAESLHSLIDMDLSLVSLLFWYIVMGGAIIGLSEDQEKTEDVSPLWVKVSIGLIGLVVIYVILGMKLSSQLRAELGQRQLNREQWLKKSQLAIKYYPFNYRNYFLTGLGYMKLRDLDKASYWLRRGEKIYPYSGEIEYNLGIIAEAKGQPREAEKRYRRAVEINPLVSPRPYLKLAAFYMRHGQKTKAKKIFYRCAYQAFPKDKAFRALKWMYKYTDVIILRDACEKEYLKFR